MTSSAKRVHAVDTAWQALDLDFGRRAHLAGFDEQIGQWACLAQQREPGRSLGRRYARRHRASGYSNDPASTRARQEAQWPPLQLCGRLSPARNAADSTGSFDSAANCSPVGTMLICGICRSCSVGRTRHLSDDAALRFAYARTDGCRCSSGHPDPRIMPDRRLWIRGHTAGASGQEPGPADAGVGQIRVRAKRACSEPASTRFASTWMPRTNQSCTNRWPRPPAARRSFTSCHRRSAAPRTLGSNRSCADSAQPCPAFLCMSARPASMAIRVEPPSTNELRWPRPRIARDGVSQPRAS